tara:strand:+ start:6637 stop:6888 length:252 start_codon:yes stop_codon:yes gene_type:complete
MIIPVRCFTCGSVISDKWITYQKLTDKHRTDTSQHDIELLDTDSLATPENNTTAEYRALQDLEITRLCCRRHFLCCVDMIDTI